ncbi:PP2A regulatory subunit TAP46-like [Primulina eburnea]|uniref:PP2A regulatory subunit TAP46-like n=1 Tax=Primulina eburnea TaxID=1245227 RepID=UPI003C6CC0C0
MEDIKLPILFEQAQKIHQIASDSSIEQETVRNSCELLRKCEDMIGKLGKNSQENRIQILKASPAKLKEFISFCEAMELVPEDELESSMQSRSNSSADQRAKKIARFKRTKAAESKLLEIKERKERRGRSTRASALSTPIERGGTRFRG